jgi:hypothetical protein
MSLINRHNYEEFFLLYIDDELSAAERQAVEEFVVLHADLRMELEMLQRSILKGEHIVFHDKDLLLKNSSLMINESNYEEYFILYGDDELNNEEKEFVEQFVYRNPKYQAEFELLQQARMQPERHVTFPDKSLLYRTEEETEKVFALQWWRIAAAAIVFVFLSGLTWYFLSKQNTTPVIVNKNPVEKMELPQPSVPVQKQESIAETKPEESKTVTAEPAVRNKIAENKKNSFTERNIDRSQPMLRSSEVEINTDEVRNIQLATTVPIEKPEVSVGKIKSSNSLAIQNKKPVVDEEVGDPEENPYAFTASKDEIEILNTTISKKNKLRGVFRKVSRIVEKTTSINPGEVKGIRIANFEIALK